MNEEQIRAIVRDEINKDKIKPMGKKEWIFAMTVLPLLLGGLGYFIMYQLSVVVGIISGVVAGLAFAGLLWKFGAKPKKA